MMDKARSPIFSTLIPLCFVTLYGSGFVGAKWGLPFAEPLTFLALRFLVTISILLCGALLFQVPWPKRPQDIFHIAVAGILMLGVFSAGVFVALYLGVSPAVSALIIALQPILVAFGASLLLGEKVTTFQWLGLGLGLLGVTLLISQKFHWQTTHLLGIGMAVLALLGLSAGNIYQKRFCANMPIVSGGIIQCFAAGCLVLLGSLIFEQGHITWTTQFVVALTWMAVVVSIGAISLLYLLIRRGEVSQVASLFYFVPVSTAVLSFVLYHETIGYLGLVGIAITALGIVLVNAKPKPAKLPESVVGEF